MGWNMVKSIIKWVYARWLQRDYQSAYDSFDKGYQVAAAAQAAALQEKDRKTGKETDKKKRRMGTPGKGQAGGKRAGCRGRSRRLQGTFEGAFV